ncbi:MAG: hypothetical protein WBV31_20735 [Terriglobales bacterium]|jgi:hypothetical protein
MMEGLIELVAASFARHGIECPAGESQLAGPAQTEPVHATRVAEPMALPDHNYGKIPQADPAA